MKSNMVEVRQVQITLTPHHPGQNRQIKCRSHFLAEEFKGRFGCTTYCPTSDRRGTLTKRRMECSELSSRPKNSEVGTKFKSSAHSPFINKHAHCRNKVSRSFCCCFLWYQEMERKCRECTGGY